MAPVFQPKALSSEKDGLYWTADHQRTSVFDGTAAAILASACSVSLFLIIIACGWCCESVEDDAIDGPRKRQRFKNRSPLASASQGSVSDRKDPPTIQISYARCERVATSFALNWFRALDSSKEDRASLIASPYAVQTAFALWYLGLNETLEERFITALFPGCNPKTGDVSTVLRTMINSTKWWRRKSIHVANRLYAPQSCRYAMSYRRRVSNLFGGQQFLEVDFPNNEASLAESMNRWTMAVTKGRAQLIQSLSKNKETGLLMISAIFVEAKTNLQYTFDRYCTRYGEPFYASATRQTSCDYMWQKRELGYFEDGRCQVLRLPYTGDVDMGLYLFLPRKRDGLAEFEATLTTDVLLDYLNNCCASWNQVEVRLPKIKVSTELKNSDLLEALSKLGCSAMDIFEKPNPGSDNDESNFAKMVHIPKKAKGRLGLKRAKNARRLWLAQMVHKATIELEDDFRDSDSISTVNLSVTSSTKTVASCSLESSGKKEPSAVPFVADHPFLFILAIEDPKLPIVIGRFCAH